MKRGGSYCVSLWGYSSVVLLSSVMVIASYLLIKSAEFSATVVTAAGGALFVDVLGLLVGVWKIALNPNFLTKLSPVTQIELPELKNIEPTGETSESKLLTGEATDPAAT